jgi:hypothetical protein
MLYLVFMFHFLIKRVITEENEYILVKLLLLTTHNIILFKLDFKESKKNGPEN